ncbi:MAG TPA: T9SS type A sorting domain-containing protein [Bacteroidia bacterium]|nr:T9SS type A sorting domain-containing protein [Bacteroidia bacterium]
MKTSTLFILELVFCLCVNLQVNAQCVINPDITVSGGWTTMAPGTINSTYIVPAGEVLEFNTGVFSFTKGRKIIVQQDGVLIISSALLRSEPVCGTMWGGIEIEPGASVYCSQSGLNEAEYGMHIWTSSSIFTTTIDVVETSFNMNYIGMDVEPLAGGNNFAIFNVVDDNFECIGTLLPPYNISTASVGTRTFAGMYLNDCNLNINGGPNWNTFTNLNIGIASVNSTLILEANAFKDIDADPFYGNIFDGSGIYGTATSVGYFIEQNGLFPTSPPYSFDNCDYGIYTEFIGLNAYNNNMLTMATGIRCLSAGDNNLRIYGNTINCTNYGVDLEDNGATPLYVGANTINVNQVLKTNGTGIFVSEFASSNIPSKSINGNFINTYDGKYGIYLLNCDSLFCQYNDIDMYNLSYNVSGIQAAYGRINTISCNDVECHWYYDLVDKTCYGINKSVDNIVAHNIAKAGGVGFLFENYCGTTAFGVNTMFHNGSRGLYLDANAVIGPQVDMGNQWVMSTGIVDAECVGTYTLSLFSANSSFPYQYPTLVIPPSWFSPSTNTPQAYDCDSRLEEEGNKQAPLDSLIYLLNNQDVSLGNSFSLIKYILNRIEFDSELLQDEAILNFYGQNTNSDELKLARFRNNLNVARLNLNRDILYLNDSIKIMSTKIQENSFAFHHISQKFIRDSILSINISTSQILHDLQNSKNNLIASSQYSGPYSISDLESLNESLSGSQTEAVSDKQVNEIYLKTFKSRLNYQLDNNSRDQIESILELCPDIAGDAPIYAAVVYHMSHPDHQLNFYQNCTPISTNRKKFLSKEDAIKIFVSPNPVQSTFRFNLNGNSDFIGELKIYNLLGEKIYEKNISFSKGTFSLESQFPSGIFYFIIKDTNGQVYSGKFQKN